MDRRSILALFLVLSCLAVSQGALAAAAGAGTSGSGPGPGPGPGPSGKCYFCKLSPVIGPLGSGHCVPSSGPLGGHQCFEADDFCSVSDPCDVAFPVGSLDVSVSENVLRDIAALHPRVSATLWVVAHTKVIASNGSVSWFDSPITADDVGALIQGDPLNLEKAPGDPVIYRHYLDQDPATGRLTLIIEPQHASDLDPLFTAFGLELTPAGDSGSYITGKWWLF